MAVEFVSDVDSEVASDNIAACPGSRSGLRSGLRSALRAVRRAGGCAL